jgi:hypothetical protein
VRDKLQDSEGGRTREEGRRTKRKKGIGRNAAKLRLINPKSEYRNPKQYQYSNAQNLKQKLRTVCC